MSIRFIDPANIQSWEHLRSAAQAFEYGNGPEGCEHFQLAKPKHQQKVYKQLQQARNAIDPEGAFASASLREKAAHINQYLTNVASKKGIRRYSDNAEWNPEYECYEQKEFILLTDIKSSLDNILPERYDPDYEPKCCCILTTLTCIAVGLGYSAWHLKLR